MLASGLSEIVADDEDLARFLMSSSYFNAIMVKRAAFLPLGIRRHPSFVTEVSRGRRCGSLDLSALRPAERFTVRLS
jgi:hypothetical protein